MDSGIIVSNAGVLSDEPVFRRTLPSKSLTDYMEQARTLDEFFDDFSGVTRIEAPDGN